MLQRVDSLRKGPTFTKPHYLPCFVRVEPRAHEPKIDRKSRENRPARASRASVAQNSDPDAHFWRRCATKWLPRRPRGVLGRPGEALEPPWGPPGTPQGRPGDASGHPADAPGAPYGARGGPEGVPGAILGRFWVPWEGSRLSLSVTSCTTDEAADAYLCVSLCLHVELVAVLKPSAWYLPEGVEFRGQRSAKP